MHRVYFFMSKYHGVQLRGKTSTRRTARSPENFLSHFQAGLIRLEPLLDQNSLTHLVSFDNLITMLDHQCVLSFVI